MMKVDGANISNYNLEDVHIAQTSTEASKGKRKITSEGLERRSKKN